MKQRAFTTEELYTLYVVLDISEGEDKPLFFKWDEKTQSSYAEEGIEGASLYDFQKAIAVANENDTIDGKLINITASISKYADDLEITDL